MSNRSSSGSGSGSSSSSSSGGCNNSYSGVSSNKGVSSCNCLSLAAVT